MADKKISALTGASTPLAGTEVLPIVQSGATVKVSVANLTAGRAVAMAGGSFTDNITQSTAAKGVNFTANTPAAGMTSQLLNWYEEGTFTPTIQFGGASTGITYSQQVGRYVRTGKTVFISIQLTLTNKGSSIGDMTVAGLPFSGSSSVSSIIQCFPIWSVSWSGTIVLAAVNASSSVLTVYRSASTASGGAYQNLNDVNFANDSIINFTGVYLVD